MLIRWKETPIRIIRSYREVENGHYVWLHVCDEELEREWNRISEIGLSRAYHQWELHPGNTDQVSYLQGTQKGCSRGKTTYPKPRLGPSNMEQPIIFICNVSDFIRVSMK